MCDLNRSTLKHRKLLLQTQSHNTFRCHIIESKAGLDYAMFPKHWITNCCYWILNGPEHRNKEKEFHFSLKFTGTDLALSVNNASQVHLSSVIQVIPSSTIKHTGPNTASMMPQSSEMVKALSNLVATLSANEKPLVLVLFDSCSQDSKVNFGTQYIMIDMFLVWCGQHIYLLALL